MISGLTLNRTYTIHALGASQYPGFPQLMAKAQIVTLPVTAGVDDVNPVKSSGGIWKYSFSEGIIGMILIGMMNRLEDYYS